MGGIEALEGSVEVGGMGNACLKKWFQTGILIFVSYLPDRKIGMFWLDSGIVFQIKQSVYPFSFLLVKIALHGRAATHFLCFAKESKQRKATAVAGLLRKLPSLREIFGAAASLFAPGAALFSQKPRSVRRRQRAGRLW
ncbi:hypothetical protein [Neisseria wadsworthii]|nr:hypothetical protein [Neisseria wadsworthii]QMT35446.1 hypothetical protein H3L96_10470 [Neisseria wadsworthii]